MDAELGVSEEQIRQEWAIALGLEDLVEDSDDILSVRQIAEWFSCEVNAAGNRAQAAVERGTMERVRIRRRGADGRMLVMNGYRLVKK